MVEFRLCGVVNLWLITTAAYKELSKHGQEDT